MNLLLMTALAAHAGDDCQVARDALALAGRMTLETAPFEALEARACHPIGTCGDGDVLVALAQIDGLVGEPLTLVKRAHRAACATGELPGKWPSGSPLRHASGKLTWPSGMVARTEAGNWAYPSGMQAIRPDGRMAWPSGVQARSSVGKWYLPAGSPAGNSAALWTWACDKKPEVCADVPQGGAMDSSVMGRLVLVEVGWAAR